MKLYLPTTFLSLDLLAPTSMAATVRGGRPEQASQGRSDDVGPPEHAQNFIHKTRVPQFVADIEIDLDEQGNRYKRKNLTVKTRQDIIILPKTPKTLRL